MSEEKFKIVKLPGDEQKLEELLNAGYYVTKEYKIGASKVGGVLVGASSVLELTSHSVQLVKLEKAIEESPELQQKVKDYLEKFGKKKNPDMYVADEKALKVVKPKK